MKSVICRESTALSSAFKIYNASAGSGKTYTLVRSYLTLLLTPGNALKFRQILAITFTNKAVGEMKSRILGQLIEFSQAHPEQKTSPLFNALAEQLDLTKEQLRLRSERVLRQILHNYAFFNISTIDKFNHKLLRTFSMDLQLPAQFEVILDTQSFLEEAIDNLFLKAGEQPEILKALIAFSLEKIESDRSWDPAVDLRKMGSRLFRENEYPHLQKLKGKTLKDFTSLKTRLNKVIAQCKNEIQRSALNQQQLLNENELQTTDFNRGYFPKFIDDLISATEKVNFNAGWKQDFTLEGLLKKSSPENTRQRIVALFDCFKIEFEKIRKLYYQIKLCENIQQQLAPFAVLSLLQDCISELQKEKSVLPISYFNPLIAREIRNQPTPYIYERLGEKYRHYFIDEFQDTSAMQWENLIPLVRNAVESEDAEGNSGSITLVGDVKQAIYRWRGGKAQQMISLLEANSPFNISPEVIPLPENYRSRATLVDFNNRFFTYSSQFLNHFQFEELFKQGAVQNPTDSSTGFVQLSILDKHEADLQQLYALKVLEIISVCRSQSYKDSDICILIRKNDDGVFLAETLVQAGIPVVSSETLLLKGNRNISILIGILRYLIYPEDRDSIFEWVFLLLPKEDRTHRNILRAMEHPGKWLENHYQINTEFARRGNALDCLENLISALGMSKGEDAYLFYLLDQASELGKKGQTGIAAFLGFWDRKGPTLSLEVPEEINAVRLMTIHKAKGLEFPVVIYPFANSAFHRHDFQMWIPTDPDSFEGFQEVLVSAKKELLNYGTETASAYSRELAMLEFDAYNVLYVAHTRAEDALFIISDADHARSPNSEPRNYSDLYLSYLNANNLWEAGKCDYHWGKLPSYPGEFPEDTTSYVSHWYQSEQNTPVSRVTKTSMLWDLDKGESLELGRLMHHLLAEIHYAGDEQAVIDTAHTNGIVSESQAHAFKILFRKMVTKEDLKKYFDPSCKILNEHELIDENNLILRPDRLVFNQLEVAIIDYKTGAKNPGYRDQLNTYARALENAGYKVTEKVIVYLNDPKIETEFI